MMEKHIVYSFNFNLLDFDIGLVVVIIVGGCVLVLFIIFYFGQAS